MAARFEILASAVKTVGASGINVVASGSAQIKDLQGNNLTVYQAETGATTVTNPITTDSAGRIEGWVEAPDFDITISDSAPSPSFTTYTLKVRQSPAGTYNVKSYGAKGDGSTDDTAAIQTASDAAGVSGGRCHAPKATYKCTAQITLSSNVEYDLTDATFNFSTSADNTQLFYITGSEVTSGTGYEALTANATEGATSVSVTNQGEFAAGDFVKVASDAYCCPTAGGFDASLGNTKIGEINVVASVSAGTVNLAWPLAGSYATADTAFIAKLTQVTDIKFKGGRIVGGGANHGHVGIDIRYGHRIRIEGTKFSDCNDSHIQLWDTVDAVVDGISVVGGAAGSSATFYGVAIQAASMDVTIANSYFRDCRHATSVGSSGDTSIRGINRRVTVTGCHSIDATDNAFDSHHPCEEYTVTGCTAYGATGSGVNCRNPSASITDNTFRRCGSGVTLRNQSSRDTAYTVTGNRCEDCSVAGINYQNPGQTVATLLSCSAGENIRYVNITGNAIYKGGTTSILISNTDSYTLKNLTVAANNCDSQASGTSCINLSATVSKAGVTGNVITNLLATATGIRVNGGTLGTIFGNTVAFASLSTGTGIRLTGTCSGFAISGNTVDSATNGITCDSTVTNCSVGVNAFPNCTNPLATFTGTGMVASGNAPGKVFTLASAATITLTGSENDFFLISGTTNIDTITASGYAGRIVKLKFAGILTVGDGTGNLKLNGNFVTTADDVLTLGCDGTSWFEMARSAN